MRTIKASGFVNAGNNLMLWRSPSLVSTKFFLESPLDVDTTVETEMLTNVLAGLRNIQHDCQGLDLTITLAKVTRLIEKLTTSRTSFRDLDNECKDVQERLDDELDSRLFLAVGSSHVPYYQEFTVGWEETLHHFPEVASDVEEASKCFALNRGTTCVFHLMRVLEVGIYALADDLSIQNLQENWQNAIEQVEKAIRVLPNKGDERKQPYSDAATHFMYIKDAWRNRTAHAGLIYADEKAQRIFENVKGFMQILASQLGEKPL